MGVCGSTFYRELTVTGLLLPARPYAVSFLSLFGDYYYLHFTHEDTEAQRGEETCPKSHSQGVVELGEKLRSV